MLEKLAIWTMPTLTVKLYYHGNSLEEIFFFLALQPPLGVVFYRPLVGLSLLAYEVSRSHTTTRHSR